MADVIADRYGSTGPPHSASQMVERGILMVFGVLRLGVVVQILASAVFVHMPLLSWVMAVLVVGWSATWFSVVWRRGTFANCPWWWGAIDVASGVASLVVMGLVLPREWVIGTWHAWAYGYASTVSPSVPAWLRLGSELASRWAAIGISLGMAVIYAIVVVPGNMSLLATGVINGFSFVIFATVAAILCPTARRIAGVADDDRERAVRLAAELERAKFQFHIHNVTGLLTHLASDDTPDAILPSLRAQALREANRLRQDVLMPTKGSPGPTSKTARTLEEIVVESLSGFGHLPLEVRTALARHVLLSPDEALVLKSAMIALLYNVQFHAGATQVVVHADCDETSWEVSVCDDGVGFDPARTSYGFGLRNQVISSAQEQGMSVEIQSRPGEGTYVFIRGTRR